MISVYIGYDTASVDCMNIAVCCPRKAVKFNHSLTAYDNVVIAESADDDLAPIFVGTRASAVTMIAQDGRCPNVGIMLKNVHWTSDGGPQGFYWALKYELKVETMILHTCILSWEKAKTLSVLTLVL